MCLKIKKIVIVGLALTCCLVVGYSWVFAEVLHTPEGLVITYYPSHFDGLGYIYSVEDKGIVIDDIFMPYAPHVNYMTPQARYASQRSFKQGQKVGYILNKYRQIETLCLIEGASKN